MEARTSGGIGVRDDYARTLFGEERVLDASAYKRGLRVELPQESQQTILFDPELLRRASDLGLFLKFVPPGQTFENLMKAADNRSHDGLPVLNNFDQAVGVWCDDPKEDRVHQDFYVEQILPGWYLCGGDVVGDATNLNFVGQTQRLCRFVKDELFNGLSMPEPIRRAVAQLREVENGLMVAQEDASRNRDRDPSMLKKLARDLVGLRINQIARETPAQVVLTHLLWGNPETRPLSGRYIHTNRLDRSGLIIRVGFFTGVPKAGGSINSTDSRYADRVTGVRLCLHESIYKHE